MPRGERSPRGGFKERGGFERREGSQGFERRAAAEPRLGAGLTPPVLWPGQRMHDAPWRRSCAGAGNALLPCSLLLMAGTMCCGSKTSGLHWR